jgi:hypothetical protein
MGSSFERNFNDGIGASAVETVEGERDGAADADYGEEKGEE